MSAARDIAPGELVNPDSVALHRSGQAGYRVVAATIPGGELVRVGAVVRDPVTTRWSAITAAGCAHRGAMRTRTKALLLLLANRVPSTLNIGDE